MAPLEQWPADPDGNQLTTKATDINGHNGDCTVMKLGIPSTLRMGPDFQMDGLSFAVTGTGGRYQIGVDTFQHFDIIIDAPQGEVFALPPHSRPEPQGQKSPPISNRNLEHDADHANGPGRSAEMGLQRHLGAGRLGMSQAGVVQHLLEHVCQAVFITPGNSVHSFKQLDQCIEIFPYGAPSARARHRRRLQPDSVHRPPKSFFPITATSASAVQSLNSPVVSAM